jgi:ABC-type Zn uptake system ZnuABC Zn-binding protein ZnuA
MEEQAMKAKYYVTRKYWSLLAAIPLLVLAACDGSPGTTATPASSQATATVAGGAKLNVVATTLQIRSMTEEVAGDRAEVRSIMPPGADAHEFEPKPSDVQYIAESDLVLENGVGLDNWTDELIENAGGERPLVTVTEGIPLREGGEHAEEEGAEAEGTKPAGEEEHEGEGYDPHVWLDVTNAMTMTRNIRDALIKADPAGEAAYRANADAYLTKLTALDDYIKGQIATIPEENRKMVTNHDALGYFINRYGLHFVGSILPTISDEAQPSAGDIAALIDKIKAENVKAIFLESSINPQLATQIANDAGVKVVDNLYADSMGALGTPEGTYEGMMRHNADTIVNALK